ncbi:MAG: glycoside hydrolase family 3 protein [Actinomycetia bacterium]|nr:glycoside hydrolase family 3 protein [Actinomycetes bacterium]
MTNEPSSVSSSLTLEEKVTLVSGQDVWRTSAITRLGLGAIKVTDGPVGARGDSTTGARAVCLPATIGLAATFDRDLAIEFGRLLGRETKRKGAQVLLAPTVNMARHPLGGRNFESFGEDPLLTAQMAVAYVQGVQSEGVAACGKHFVANDVEYSRMTISSEVSDTLLREIYLAPFEALVEAGIWSLMASYPKLNGQFCTENHWLLTTLLRHEWGFDGLVMSDWGATHHRSRPILAGLDLEMPGPARAFGPNLLAAIADGEVNEDDIDTRVRAVLDLANRTGRLGLSEAESGVDADTERSINEPGEQALARAIAADAMVLVANDGLLPLDETTLSSLAIIGPNAEAAVEQGGGSAQVPAHYVISPLEGFRAALPNVELSFQSGCLAHRYLPPIPTDHWLGPDTDTNADTNTVGGGPITVDEFSDFEPTGEPTRSRRTHSVAAFIHGDQEHRAGSQRWTGHLPIESSGRYRFAVLAVGRSRVLIDGVLVVDNWTDPQPGEAFFQMASSEVVGEVDLEAGTVAEVVVEWSLGRDALLAGLRFGYLPPVDEDDLLDQAVEAAADADAAVVVVGLNSEWETEGHDRVMYGLPGRQNELIERVTAANPRTVVVVNAGSPVEAPWFDTTAATILAWYPGQELGAAMADVVLGRTEPGGRLPITWPRALADAPFELPMSAAGPPDPGATMAYEEGLDIGYRSYDRRDIEPLAPFGFGLGYTTFDLAPPTVTSTPADPAGSADRGAPVEILVPVTNTGSRRGKAVVQVYLECPAGHDDRPLRQLAGFTTVRADPGQTIEATIVVGPRSFQRWSPTDGPGRDKGDGHWVQEAGRYRLHLGTSSRQLQHLIEVEREQID